MAARTFRHYVLDHARRVWRELAASRSPLTDLNCALIAVVFAIQMLEATRVGTSVRTLTNYLFYVRPAMAWPLAYFLHGGVAHVSGNLLLIFFLGRVTEARSSALRYVSFVVGAATASVLGGVLAIALFDDGPVVAYGASGLGFALAGYSLQYLRYVEVPPQFDGRPSPLSSAEWLAVVVGVAAVFTVAVDVATGPFFDPFWLNGAHAVGLAFGVVVGWRWPPHRQMEV
jgi:membrane associated rhomboid family serine protease